MRLLEKTKRGVGALFYCTSTKRFLLLKRAFFCEEPHTWNLVAGTVEFGENNIETLKREIKEETGLRGNYKIVKKICELKKTNSFFTIYLAFVEDEFIPQLADFENTDYIWIEKIENISPLHSGMKYLLRKNLLSFNHLLVNL